MTIAVTANSQSYLGQWYSEETDTYLLFDADSLVYAYGVEPENCYEFETFAHVDDGELDNPDRGPKSIFLVYRSIPWKRLRFIVYLSSEQFGDISFYSSCLTTSHLDMLFLH